MAQRPPVQNEREPIIYGGFRLGERGLTCVDTPSREQWSECLTYLLHLEQHIHFWIGDLLVYGEWRWGEMYAEMLSRTGYEPRTLRTLKWVASSVDVARRRAGLSFAHHQEVAGLAGEEQDAMLDQAERRGWTREMVRHAVNRLAYERERPDVAIASGLHHGDCRSIMATLPDESVDLLLTDPPQQTDTLTDFESALAGAAQKLKPNSHAYFFTTWQGYEEVAGIVERFLTLRNTLVWPSSNYDLGSDETNYSDAYRLVLFAHKGRRHLSGRRDSDVLPFAERDALQEFLIEKSTQEQECVLDPFMRAGSVCLAARNRRRGYIGIERDRERYDMACAALAVGS